MDTLDSEKEQLAKIKQWVQENGMSIVLGIVLGLGAVYGWRGWQDYQVRQAEASSAIMTAIEQHLANDEFEKAAVVAEQLIEDASGDLYKDMSRLMLARARVEQGLLEQATVPLQAIVAGGQSVFESIAKLRLVRIYLALSRLADAEEIIIQSTDASYAQAFEELRGDLERARGQHEAARAAYLNSLVLASDDTNTQFLQMKLDDLPSVKPVE